MNSSHSSPQALLTIRRIKISPLRDNRAVFAYRTMSATTTTPPAKAVTPQESDEEIMKEWDGVTHFDDSDDDGQPGEFFIALCGAEMVCDADSEWNGEELINECPICRALYDERHPS